MFRGKESSNRIELSRLVQDLLNFGVWLPAALGGGWMGVGDGWGVPPHTCTCMHMHTCTCACGKHDNFMQMVTPIGESWEFPMMSYACACACVCMCMRVHACMCVCTCMGHPLTTPLTSTHPPPPGGTLRIS